MEQVATVEPAEPQGSAAPSEPSFGALYRAHVERRPPPTSRGAVQPATQPAPTETSAADERGQDTAADASPAGTPARPSPDGNPDPQATETGQPKLSRSQRKALKQGEAAPTGDTSAPGDAGTEQAGSPATAAAPDVVGRVERLEAMLRPPDPDEQAFSKEYAEAFGDDAEFARLSQVYLYDRNNFPADKYVEFEEWADRRKYAQINDLKWKRNLSAAAVYAAEQHGLDRQAIATATSPIAIFEAFVNHGRSLSGADATLAKEASEWRAKAEKAEAASRALADEVEALKQRLPASLRGPVSGGLSATYSATPPIDRQKATGTQLMAAGLAARARPQTGGRNAGGYVRPTG